MPFRTGKTGLRPWPCRLLVMRPSERWLSLSKPNTMNGNTVTCCTGRENSASAPLPPGQQLLRRLFLLCLPEGRPFPSQQSDFSPSRYIPKGGAFATSYNSAPWLAAASLRWGEEIAFPRNTQDWSPGAAEEAPAAVFAAGWLLPGLCLGTSQQQVEGRKNCLPTPHSLGFSVA